MGKKPLEIPNKNARIMFAFRCISMERKDLEHWFVLKYASFKENATVIGRSLSFGLVLFCLGLCATLIYLLVSTLG